MSVEITPLRKPNRRFVAVGNNIIEPVLAHEVGLRRPFWRVGDGSVETAPSANPKGKQFLTPCIIAVCINMTKHENEKKWSLRSLVIKSLRNFERLFSASI